jgi:hypothetical protein
VKTTLGILRLEAGRHRLAGGDEEKRQRSAGVGKGMELTGGPHMAVTGEREGVSARVNKVEGNTPFYKYASAGGAGPDGPKSEENYFLNKN